MSDDILTEEGFLVLADISGFTAFMTATELEHGAEITGLLLQTLIQELEGDAVFALGPDRIVADGRTMPPLLAEAFAAFTERQRRIASEPGCECGACRETSHLSLKLIAHHGRFVRQLVGGRSRVTGPDVILAHRLLKNAVGVGAYALFTEPALARAGLDPVARGMGRHRVSYPYLGEVSCFVTDLIALAPPAAAGAAVGAA